MNSEAKKLTPERVMSVMSKKNIVITYEQAKQVSEFLNMMAEMAVKQLLRKQVTAATGD